MLCGMVTCTGVKHYRSERGGERVQEPRGVAGVAGIGDEDWNKLQDFDTHRLIEAADEVDALRGMLADDRSHPLEIRDRLLKLHSATILSPVSPRCAEGQPALAGHVGPLRHGHAARTDTAHSE